MPSIDKICLFHDYAGGISTQTKGDILRRHEVEITEVPRPPEGSMRESWSGIIEQRRAQYGDLLADLARAHGRFAPDVLEALMTAHRHDQWARTAAGEHHDLIVALGEVIRQQEASYTRTWALDPANWYRIAAPEGSIQLQDRISEDLPCAVFPNLPLEAVATGPEVKLSNLDEILESTGIYQVWRRGNLGQAAHVWTLDTGVSSDLASRFSITTESVPGLTPEDVDGHGTAVAELMLAIAPEAKMTSMRVMRSSSDSNIWNLIAGLTSLGVQRSERAVVNLSLGVPLHFLQQLGSQRIAFKSSVENLVKSATGGGHFVVAAAGNDGRDSLRLPAAAPESLAVGSHNRALYRSSHSNYSTTASNFVLVAGGEEKTDGAGGDSFGRYGVALSPHLSPELKQGLLFVV